MGKFGSPQVGRFAEDFKESDNPDLNKCPNCGALTDGKVCPICKQPIPEKTKNVENVTTPINSRFCEYCGTRNKRGYKKCTKCGKKPRSVHGEVIAVLVAGMIVLGLFTYRYYSMYTETEASYSVLQQTLQNYVNKLNALMSSKPAQTTPVQTELAPEIKPTETTAAEIVTNVLYSNNDLEIAFDSATVSDWLISESAVLTLSVTNKTKDSLYVELSSIALNGQSFSGFTGDDYVAPQSTAKMKFTMLYADSETVMAFKEKVEYVSGFMSYGEDMFETVHDIVIEKVKVS